MAKMAQQIQAAKKTHLPNEEWHAFSESKELKELKVCSVVSEVCIYSKFAFSNLISSRSLWHCCHLYGSFAELISITFAVSSKIHPFFPSICCCCCCCLPLLCTLKVIIPEKLKEKLRNTEYQMHFAI